MSDDIIKEAEEIAKKFSDQDLKVDLGNILPFDEAVEIERRFLIAWTAISACKRRNYQEGVLSNSELTVKYYKWLEKRGYIKPTGEWKKYHKV